MIKQISANIKTHIMLNRNKHTKRNLNLNQHANIRTVHMCVHITVHNCCA